MVHHGISGDLVDPALNLAVFSQGADPGLNSDKDILKNVIRYGRVVDPTFYKTVEPGMVLFPYLLNSIHLFLASRLE